MEDANGRPDTPDEREELPPGLSAWFAIEQCVVETIDALECLDDETDRVIEFVTGIHRDVKAWLSWEMWATILSPGGYTPDSLFEELLQRGIDVRRVGADTPATPPETGHAPEWRAFEGGVGGA